jgi:hypothetical protein
MTVHNWRQLNNDSTQLTSVYRYISESYKLTEGTVEPGYNDIGVYDTSLIKSDISR